MSKTCLTPVNGYDIPALERWLEEKAARGLLFSMTLGPLTCFEEGEAAQVRVHLEPAREKTEEEDPELTALYEQAGWRFLGVFRKNFFVYATDDREARAYTDPESQSYALGRFFRQKLLGGVGLLIANLLLFFLYWNLVPWGAVDLRWFPVTAFSSYPLLAVLLTALGLAAVDLSWLFGLLGLRRYRQAAAAGKRPAAGARGGWLLTVGFLLLLPVAINTVQLFAGLDYRPYDIMESNFLTLEEIEGDGFQVTGDRMYNMDYVSHGGTLLTAESWYWRQYGAFAHYEGGDYWNQVPMVKYSIYKYPLTALARARVEEESRIRWSGMEPRRVGDFAPDIGFEELVVWRGEDQWSGAATLILRRGRLVMRVEYRGDKDLLEFQPQLAAMMAALE